MTYFLIFLVSAMVVIISLFSSVLILAANEFVKENEISYRRKTYIRYISLAFKKSIKAIIAKKDNPISPLSFFVNTLHYILMVGIVSYLSLLSLDIDIIKNNAFSVSLKKYAFLTIIVFTFLTRIIGHISNYSKIDINKFMLKSFASVGLIFLNFSYSLYFIVKYESYTNLEVIIKIILFINLIISIYIFDGFTKFKSKNSTYSLNIFDNINLYFILVSVFVFLNSHTDSNSSIYKFMYYTVSILLIELIVNYIKKIIGHTKLKQSIKYIFEYLVCYYAITFLILIGVENVL